MQDAGFPRALRIIRRRMLAGTRIDTFSVHGAAAAGLRGVVVRTKGTNRLLVTIELIKRSRSRATSESALYPGQMS